MVSLVLQVLGNSDIKVDSSSYQELSKYCSLERISEEAKSNNEDLLSGIEQVDFPLVRKILESPILTEKSENSNGILWCFLLTDQRQWLSQRNDGEGCDVVAKDGIWWQEVLAKWCEGYKLQPYFLPLKIGADVENGAADWEGMAQKIEQVVTPRIAVDAVDKNKLYFHPPKKEPIWSPPPKEDSIPSHPPEGDRIPIDKITVQHSSGTPALNAALYLWGIERKLMGIPIDFVYISDQELDCKPHSGIHWQWHLKLPQIRELLKIQDFSGALQILKSHHHAKTTSLAPSAAASESKNYEKLVNNLEELDRAVSLNLTGHPNLTGQEGIIERVAIALWSEKAFRQRSQWMHWYLRIAGAFELAILLLIEERGNSQYQWVDNTLVLKGNPDFEINKIRVSKLVEFVENGEIKEKFRGDTYNLTCRGIESAPGDKWRRFVNFYINEGWYAGVRPKKVVSFSFTDIRNKLYHSLLGDRIDEFLDKKTEALGSVTDSKHPAQVAVDHLDYIIKLAGITDQVKERTDKYRQIVQKIEENL